MTITLQQLESRLWDAANALRGPVDPADFKTYVFPMLFWKWISDTWEFEHAQALSKYGDNLTDEIEADYHRFELPDGARWNQVIIKTNNLGAGIAKSLLRIEQANPQSLPGIFGDAAWGNKERIPESALVGLIRAFNSLDLNPGNVSHDMLGQASSLPPARSSTCSSASSNPNRVSPSTTRQPVREACSSPPSTTCERRAWITGRCACTPRKST
jgi:type I restriction enzyme M protein